MMFTDVELGAYLDEDLDAVQMAEIEKALRSDPAILKRLTIIRQNTLNGAHSLGAIWRRHRLSCPSREQLGNYLLEIMSPEEQRFIKTHIDLCGCRQCQANLDDLQQQSEAALVAQTRRTRYFQSSAGYLSQQRDQSDS